MFLLSKLKNNTLVFWHIVFALLQTLSSFSTYAENVLTKGRHINVLKGITNARQRGKKSWGPWERSHISGLHSMSVSNTDCDIGLFWAHFPNCKISLLDQMTLRILLILKLRAWLPPSHFMQYLCYYMLVCMLVWERREEGKKGESRNKFYTMNSFSCDPPWHSVSSSFFLS